ncbi:MAG: ATP synthase F1 subunit gamma [Lachnospiraceae bacterium]|jgi:F-type H+-transporting ATPase subunit gamma|nr:ATP synthase F1 subunit gamma [Lachnospiraceae bacterium]
MANTREIQLRIRSISGTQQITRAMKLVSTAKLQKIRGIAEEGRPYFKRVYQTVCSILQASTEDVSALAGFSAPAGAENMPMAYVLITSDRGLAGGYNANICRLLENEITDKEQALIITIGKRGKEYFERRGYRVDAHFDQDGEAPQMAEINRISRYVMGLYTEGKVSGVRVAYTAFQNTLTQIPQLMQLFPLNREDFQAEEDLVSMNYEPGAEEVMARIMPLYISGVLHGALAEAAASEQGARMTAMDAATDNAGDIIDRLTLQYNRARQGHITQELTEIINGAAALE